MLNLLIPKKYYSWDYETVPEKATFDELSETEKNFLRPKTQYQRSEDQSPASFYKELEYGPSLVKSFVYLWVFLI